MTDSQSLFDALSNDTQRLFAVLNDPLQRDALYRQLCEQQQVLPFTSRVSPQVNGNEIDPEPETFSQTAYLVAHPDHLAQVFARPQAIHQPVVSNSAYEGLGGKTFMLSMDDLAPGNRHDSQKHYAMRLLGYRGYQFDALATLAFKAGALGPLKSQSFDLVGLAENMAVNYIALLFGFPQSDLALIRETSLAVGRGLHYQTMARHFVSDQSAVLQARQGLDVLTRRIAELIDIWHQPVNKAQTTLRDDWCEEQDTLRRTGFPHARGQGRPWPALRRFVPVIMKAAIRRYRHDGQTLSTYDKAVVVSGLVAGSVANLRDSLCNSVQYFFSQPAEQLHAIHHDATESWLASRMADLAHPQGQAFVRRVGQAMQCRPAAAFIPRLTRQPLMLAGGVTVPANRWLVLALGGAQFLSPGPGRCPHALIFGGDPKDRLPASAGQPPAYRSTHACPGDDMALHAVVYALRQIMALPGLTQAVDDKTGLPLGLETQWGYSSVRYPMEYQRERLLRQSPLQTVLRVKTPVAEHAARLRQVLRMGAPFIEKVLRDSKMVHFASFMMLDHDSKLILFTTYDGDFDSYIDHFAHEFGPLFDRFFEHIEDAPPLPIREHTFAFVQYLRRQQCPPVEGYFFSAYPQASAAAIVRQHTPRAELDFFWDDPV